MRYVISDEHRVYEMSPSNRPVMEIPIGSEVVFMTRDCFDGQVNWDEFPECLEHLDGTRTNPSTGPIAIKGVKSGDIVTVEIIDIDVAEAGFSNGIKFPVKDGEAYLAPGITHKIAPVVGVIGVAPRDGAIKNSTPGDHGGNLDTKEITVGSKVHLTAQVDGGLLAMGDVHALQGDGEVCGQGIEIAAEISVRITKSDRRFPPKPVIETRDAYYVLSSGDTFEQIFDELVILCRDWLVEELGVEPRRAHAMLSLLGGLGVSQIVNPLKTGKMRIPKSIIDPQR